MPAGSVASRADLKLASQRCRFYPEAVFDLAGKTTSPLLRAILSTDPALATLKPHHHAQDWASLHDIEDEPVVAVIDTQGAITGHR